MYHYPQRELVVTAEHERLLRSLVVTDEQPGTILHDFNLTLEVLRKSPVTLTDGV